MSWFDSLPTWLQWMLMAPLLLLGNAMVWFVVLQGNGSPLPLPQWMEPSEGEKGLWVWLKVALGFVVMTLGLDALFAAFFLPSLFYWFVLGWSWDASLWPGFWTTIGLIVAAYIVFCLYWDRQDRKKAEREMEAANESRKRGELAEADMSIF